MNIKFPTNLKNKKPIIGYIGGFNEKLDNKIILDIAEKEKKLFHCYDR